MWSLCYHYYDSDYYCYNYYWSQTGRMRRWRVVAFVGASVADRFRMQEVTEPVGEWFAVRGRRSRVSAGRPTGCPASALVADRHKQ